MMQSPPTQTDVLLVTVNPHETQAVLQAFHRATGSFAKSVAIEDRVYRDLGTVNETNVFHAISEMGSGGLGGAQQTVDKAIRALNPGAVIAVGIAFGIDERKQAIGDILLSKQLRPYDLQRVGGKILLRGDKPHASTRLINFFEGAAQVSWQGSPVRSGVILTGEKLVDDLDYRTELIGFEPEALGGEMEGAGVYAASQEHKVDWIVIKAICDWGDGQKAKNKAARQKKAATHAARFILHALQQTPLKSKRARQVDGTGSEFQRNIPVEQVAKSLSRRTIDRLRSRKGPLESSSPHVPRVDISEAIDTFLKSDKRVLVLKGLPGAGKTTSMLHVAQQHDFLTALGDTAPSERWSAQLDRDLASELGASSMPFLSFCRAFADRPDAQPLRIFVDELERAADPAQVISQIAMDLAGLPANVKAIAAIRWANFSTQREAQVLSRSDTTLHEVAELHGETLQAFLAAYNLPIELPRGVRHVLNTPFAIRVFSSFGGTSRSFANLGSMMECLFEQLFDSSKAKELFLEAVGSTALANNSIDAMSVKSIIASAARNNVPLAISDCDSDLPTSALRFFINKGILLEDRDGIRATHDLWIECLVARALRSVLRDNSLSATLELLLNVDFGVRWSALLIMPGILRETELRDLAQNLVAVVATFLSTMTEEERKRERDSSRMLKHMALGGAQPAPTALRHVLEMRRSSNTGDTAVLRASRAAELLTIMFGTVPNLVGSLIHASDEDTASWLFDALVPNVVVDPFVVSLIDVSNREAVLLLLKMTVSLVPVAVGGFISSDGSPSDRKPIELKAFEGPRLATIFPRAKMNGFHLLFPYAFVYMPVVFPSLMTFAGDGTDDHVMGYLERIADYVSVAIAMAANPEAGWARLISRLPAETLPIAGWILGTTYPHVEPTTLLHASLERLRRDPSAFEQIRTFGAAVVIQAMRFVLLGFEKATTEHRLLRFARAIDVWRLDVSVSGANLLEEHVQRIDTEPERLVVHCLIFLSFHLRHLAASEEPETPSEMGQFPAESINAAQQYLVSSLKGERETARENLVKSLAAVYDGYHPEADPSRLPQELAAWLRAAERAAEAAEMERAGEVLSYVCDRVFGVPAQEGNSS